MQFMRRIILPVALLLVFLFSFGCLNEKVTPARLEQTTNTQEFDLDKDTSPDYMVFDYAPIKSDSGMILQRQVMVSVETSGGYTSVKPNLTDLTYLMQIRI